MSEQQLHDFKQEVIGTMAAGSLNSNLEAAAKNIVLAILRHGSEGTKSQGRLRLTVDLGLTKGKEKVIVKSTLETKELTRRGTSSNVDSYEESFHFDKMGNLHLFDPNQAELNLNRLETVNV